VARTKNKENTVSDVDLDIEDAPAAEASGETAEAKQSKKDPVPEGYVKPTALAKELGIRPQQVYGYIRNGSGFPHKNNTDGSFIVPVGSGDPETDARAWIEERRKRRAEREAKKAAEAQAAAETPAEG
jgi:hypothetical protein